MSAFSWVAFVIRAVGGILQVAGFGIVAIQLSANQRDAGIGRSLTWSVIGSRDKWQRLRGKDVGYCAVGRVL